MKVKDLLPMEIDIDVYDDVCEELGIAFCGPMRLTPEGERQFAEVLNYEIKIQTFGGMMNAIVQIDGDGWKKRLKKAIEFFHSAAGYCSCEDYDKWFILD